MKGLAALEALAAELGQPLVRAPKPARQVANNNNLTPLAVLLPYLPADVGRGNGSLLGPDGKPIPDSWLGTLWGVRAAYGDAAKEVIREWSQTSSRYDQSGFDSAWEAFNPDHPSPVGVGSLLQFAKANGWSGSPPADVAPVPCSTRYRLLTGAAILAIQPIEWRVKGLLPTTGIGVIYGPSMSGKSFLAINMGLQIARGQNWFGRRTTDCPVTYVMLEGEAGLRNRMMAATKFSGEVMPKNFYAIAQPFSFPKPQDVADLAATLPKGGVVIIDTMNCAGPGLDENSSKDMGIIIAGMKDLQRATGGLVLVVHHTGKDSSKGMRGHSSLLASLDCAIEVTRSDERRSWRPAKVKDGDDGGVMAFKLHVVELGVDSDGDRITSCAISAEMGLAPERREPSGKAQKAALSVIRSALQQSSDAGRGGCGPQAPRMSVTAAISAYAATLTTDAPNRRTTRAKTVVQSLIDSAHLRTGLDDLDEGWVWCA